MGFVNTAPPNCMSIIPLSSWGEEQRGQTQMFLPSMHRAKPLLCGITELLPGAGWCSCLSGIPRELPWAMPGCEAPRAHLRVQGATHNHSHPPLVTFWGIHPPCGFSSTSGVHLKPDAEAQKTFWSSDLCFYLSFPNLAPFQLHTGDTRVAWHQEHSQGLGSTTKAFVPIFTQGFFMLHLPQPLVYWEHGAQGKGKPQSLYCCQAKCH